MRILVTTLLLVSSFHLGWAQDPQISERIIPEIKRIGTTGRLHCTVVDKQDYPVYWIHKDSQTTISSDDKILIDDIHNQVINGWPKFMVRRSDQGKSITFSLIINRLEPRDMGNYTCQILVRGSDKHPSKDGEMIVLSPPASIHSRMTNTIVANIGDNITLHCDATGYPQPNMTWVRVNAGLLPNGKMREPNKDLNITNVKMEDRGIFRCLADNNVRPPASHDATLFVNFRPSSRAVQSSYGQAQNRMFDVTIECRVSGFPEPDLQWYKVTQAGHWEPIRNDDKHQVNIMLDHAKILLAQERWLQLVVRTVQANDFGDYICQGRNMYGTGHAVINVYETSECQGPNCPAENAPGSASRVGWTGGSVMVVGVSYLLMTRS